MKPRTGARILAGGLVLVALYLTSRYSYLLFHTLVELFTVVVLAGVFVVAWNARRNLENSYLLFVGVSSLFVALVDLFHALAYEGMGVVAGWGSEEATQLWLAGRSLQAAAVVAAPFFLGRPLRVPALVVGYGVATALLLGSILVVPVFPAAFVPGQGLTPFKIGAEYVLAAAFAGAAVLLVRKRGAFDRYVWGLLVAWLGLMVLAELAFTAYATVYGEANLLGHLVRLVASYLLYKAIIERGMVQPHAILVRDLKRSEDRLREYADALESRNRALRDSESELRDRARALELRNQELDAFARTVAHDLKTPLSVVVANAELLRLDSGLDEDRARNMLARIQRTAVDMAGIIEALLLLAEVRKADVPRQPLDMASLVERVRDRYRERIQESGAQVVVQAGWPGAVGYAPWVMEVWSNYLANALVHAGPSPRIELGGAPDPGGMIRFWVRDDGPGVPPGARKDLFVPFRKRGKVRSNGYGLGLSIVLQIVEKLGGVVGIESEPGEGSTFYFTLPAAPAPVPADAGD